MRYVDELNIYSLHDLDIYLLIFFIRKPVRCDRNGKIHLQVFLDDFVQHRAEPEGIFVGVRYQGNRTIDLDPDICDHALVTFVFFIFVKKKL